MSLFFNVNDFVSDIGYPLEECGILELENDINEDYVSVIESMYIINMENIKYGIVTENAFKTFMSKVKEFFKQLWEKIKKFFSWIKSLFTGKLKQFKEISKHHKSIGKFVKDMLSSGSSSEKDPVSNEFKDIVKKKDILGLKIILKNSLIIDPTAKTYNAQIKYIEEHIDDFWEEHDGKTYENNPAKWTNKLVTRVAVDIVENFSRERAEFYKKLCKYVFIKGKNRITHTKGFVDIKQLPSEVQAQINGGVNKIRAFIQKEKGENANVVDEISKPENLNKFLYVNGKVVKSINGDKIKFKEEQPFSLNMSTLAELQKIIDSFLTHINKYQDSLEKFLNNPNESLGKSIDNQFCYPHEYLIKELKVDSLADINNDIFVKEFTKGNDYLLKKDVLDIDEFLSTIEKAISGVEKETLKMGNREMALIQKIEKVNITDGKLSTMLTKFVNRLKEFTVAYTKLNGELSKAYNTYSDLAKQASEDLKTLREFI